MDDRSRGSGPTSGSAISAGRLTRRAALGLGVGGVLAGCAGMLQPASHGAGGEGIPATAATSTPSAPATIGPTTSGTGPAAWVTGQPGAATLAELEARYDGLAPRD